MKKRRHVYILYLVFLLIVSFSIVQAQMRAKKPLQPLVLPDLTVQFQGKIQPALSARSSSLAGVKIVIRNIGKDWARDFVVDVFFSTDQVLSGESPQFGIKEFEDMIIPDGRTRIRALKPGGTLTLPLSGGFQPDKRPPSGQSYLGVKVDSLNSVKEANEYNNIDWILIPFVYPVSITSYSQWGYMHQASNGMMCLVLSGTGFGSSPGNKEVVLGPHVLQVNTYEWTNNSVVAYTPASVPFAQTYDCYIRENSVRISNKIQVFLQMYVLDCVRQIGNNYVDSGPSGSEIEIHGAHFGNNQGNLAVRFGSVSPAITSWSDTKIVFNCPSLAPGSYQVYITQNGQDITFQKSNFTITAEGK